MEILKMEDRQTINKAPTAPELNRLKDFILWAKENEVQLHEVDFGSIKLTLTDLELLEQATAEETTDLYSRDSKETAEPQTMYDELAKMRGVTP